MRIGMDATPIFLHLGGVGYHILNILKHLARIDHENEYILYNAGPSANRAQTPFQHTGNFQIINIWRPILRWRMKRDRIDVFHGPNHRLPARGLKGSVVTIHDLSVQRLPHLFRKRSGWQRDFNKNKQVLDRADRIIAVSKCTAHDIIEFYGVSHEKIDVIYNGISEDFFQETDQEHIKKVREKYKIGSRDYLLFVGGPNPRKNAVSLLQSFALMRAAHKDLLLVLVGEMTRGTEQVYQMIDKLMLGNSVIFSGSVPIESMRALYSQAAAFIYPSLYEGFGMPVLEAMACGAPVIASNTSSIPEVAGDAAVLINPTDIEALATSIETILKDQITREAMKSKGFTRAKLFSWEIAARQTLEVYKRCLS